MTRSVGPDLFDSTVMPRRHFTNDARMLRQNRRSQDLLSRFMALLSFLSSLGRCFRSSLAWVGISIVLLWLNFLLSPHADGSNARLHTSGRLQRLKASTIPWCGIM